MRWDRLELLRQRQVTAERAKEFLGWLTELEAELKDQSWQMLAAKKADAAALHDLNSFALAIGALKGFLREKADDGIVAEMEVKEDGGADDGE